MELEEFIKSKKRDFSARQTQTNRFLRLKTLVTLTNKHTELYMLNKIPEGNFLTLQDSKNYCLKLKNNPFDMVEGEANAKICSDYHRLCIKGINVEGKPQVLTAKSLGINRVCYFNIQLARQLIHDTKDNKVKAQMQDRLKLINELPNREGYQPL